MGFHDRYHTDKSAEEEGTWVNLGENIAVKVRRYSSAHAKATRRKLEEPHAALMRGGNQLPEDILEDILIKQMSQSLIIDWKGITDKDGKDIPATPETIDATLRAYPEFKNEVAAIVLDRTTFKKMVQKDDLKNS